MMATIRPPCMAVSRRLLAASSSSGALSNAAAFDAQYASTESQKRTKVLEREHLSQVDYSMQPRKLIPKGLVPFPSYAISGQVGPSQYHDCILLHDEASIQKMRQAARLARRVLEQACDMAVEGNTTEAINDVVHDSILAEGAYPSPLNYAGFPKSLCTSINEVICHGIPNSRELKKGDVVSFDVSCFLNGVHGDNCATVIVGDEENVCEHEQTKDEGGSDWRGVPFLTTFEFPSQQELFITARRLVQATKESLDAAISVCKPGGCLTEVGEAIQVVADAYGYESVKKYRGHGIGSEFHCAPFVKHYRNNDRLSLRPGMIFTIEPMLVEGSSDCYEWDDHWTVVTCDGGLAAQFEHTVLITETGAEILTLPA